MEENLSGQPSRTLALHDAITQIVFSQPEEATADLRDRLEKSVVKLGAWTETSVDWTSPVFMASHALRLASKENYDLVMEPDGEGGERRGCVLRWPEAQWRWLQEQSSAVVRDTESFNRSLAVRMAMDDENKSVRVAVADAKSVLEETNEVSIKGAEELHDPEDPWLSRVAAAAFVTRFGSDAEVQADRETLSKVFDHALQQGVRDLPNLRYDVMYDAHALAITGRLYLASRFQRGDDCRALLDAVSAYSASAVSAFSRHCQAAKGIGDRRLLAVIRIGLQGCIVSRPKDFDEDEAAFDGRQSKLSEIQLTRMAAELDWIERNGDQREWPSPPLRQRRRPRRSITIPGGKPKPSRTRRQAGWPDYYFDDNTGAVWLRTLSRLSNVDVGAVFALLRANCDWLVDANSPGEDDEDEGDLEQTWTRGLMECAAAQAKGWSDQYRKQLIFDVLGGFSEEAFLDTAAAFLIQSDLVHIEGDATDTAYLVDIRYRLWRRLKETRRWRQHLWSRRDGMEIHLKELIAAFFFKLSHGFGSEQAYTKGLVEDQITPFLPLLTEIAAASAPCPTIALLFLDVLELIEPKKAEPPLLTAATRWTVDGDQRFWNELGVGRRVCAIMKKAEIKSPARQWAEISDVISAKGVAAGETLKQMVRGTS